VSRCIGAGAVEAAKERGNDMPAASNATANTEPSKVRVERLGWQMCMRTF
jgi:hypothetical protein